MVLTVFFGVVVDLLNSLIILRFWHVSAYSINIVHNFIHMKCDLILCRLSARCYLTSYLNNIYSFLYGAGVYCFVHSGIGDVCTYF